MRTDQVNDDAKIQLLNCTILPDADPLGRLPYAFHLYHLLKKDDVLPTLQRELVATADIPALMKMIATHGFLTFGMQRRLVQLLSMEQSRDCGGGDMKLLKKTFRKNFEYSIVLYTANKQSLFMRLSIVMGKCTKKAYTKYPPAGYQADGKVIFQELRNQLKDHWNGVGNASHQAMALSPENVNWVPNLVHCQSSREFGKLVNLVFLPIMMTVPISLSAAVTPLAVNDEVAVKEEGRSDNVVIVPPFSSPCSSSTSSSCSSSPFLTHEEQLEAVVNQLLVSPMMQMPMPTTMTVMMTTVPTVAAVATVANAPSTAMETPDTVELSDDDWLEFQWLFSEEGLHTWDLGNTNHQATVLLILRQLLSIMLTMMVR
jgi:hypothetical protein